jgi:hypothetical protein
MALEYILGQDIFFWSVGVSGGPSFSKKLGILYFQGLKVYFQIWKCALFQMENINKIGGMVLTVDANIGVLF